jgi:hypothetical protein
MTGILCGVKYFATASGLERGRAYFPDSTGPPASVHARHPPAIDATFV